MSEISLRPEKPEDRSHIATLIARTYGAEGVRLIELTSSLRDWSSHDPDLALIGEENGETAAYALFTPLKVGGKEGDAVLLAPLALDTNRPELDYMTFLDHAMDKVAAKGYTHVILHGDKDSFAPAGFVDGAELELKSDLKFDGASFLVKVLKDGAALKGKVTYPPFLQKDK